MLITWPIAFTIVLCVIALLTFLHKMLNKEVTLEDVKIQRQTEEKIEKVKTDSEEKIETLKLGNQNNKKDIEALEKEQARQEKRMKDLLDMFIDFLKEH